MSANADLHSTAGWYVPLAATRVRRCGWMILISKDVCGRQLIAEWLSVGHAPASYG